jgi:hypothetical protein
MRPSTTRWVCASALNSFKCWHNIGTAGLNTLQIIEQCKKSVSKLVAHALDNDNYLEPADIARGTDFGRRRLVFLEVNVAMKLFYELGSTSFVAIILILFVFRHLNY